MLKSKELETKISHAHSLILSQGRVLVVMMKSKELKSSRSILMLIL